MGNGEESFWSVIPTTSSQSMTAFGAPSHPAAACQHDSNDGTATAEIRVRWETPVAGSWRGGSRGHSSALAQLGTGRSSESEKEKQVGGERTQSASAPSRDSVF